MTHEELLETNGWMLAGKPYDEPLNASKEILAKAAVPKKSALVAKMVAEQQKQDAPLSKLWSDMCLKARPDDYVAPLTVKETEELKSFMTAVPDFLDTAAVL